jgi:hypothetical protein
LEKRCEVQARHDLQSQKPSQGEKASAGTTRTAEVRLPLRVHLGVSVFPASFAAWADPNVRRLSENALRWKRQTIGNSGIARRQRSSSNHGYARGIRSHGGASAGPALVTRWLLVTSRIVNTKEIAGGEFYAIREMEPAISRN